jgi:hypothetical protein
VPQPKKRAKNANYYDLVKIPHGHIPAPKLNLWSSFPIPVKARRGNHYYFCPTCGAPSFFKVEVACWGCQEDFYSFDEFMTRYYRKKRRNYFRRIWKRLEYLFLPLLVLLGKAWYVQSVRLAYWEEWDYTEPDYGE